MPPAAALASAAMLLGGGAAVGVAQFRRQRREFLAAWERAHLAERDRSRMREELEGARAIQLAMLPHGAPDLPWLEIAATSRPATEVGGDYYDYFPLGPDRLAVAIGDVAGHGLGSGIVLAGVRAGLHLLRDELGAPERVIERLNGVVRDAGPERLLMTLGLLVLDRAGTARWVPAGHPPALRWTRGSRAAVAVEASCPPLGTKLPVRPTAVESSLAEGDVWLLVTDGTFETRDRSGAPFGEARMAETLARLAGEGGDAREILDGLLAELDGHRGGAEPEDDLTAVVARRRERA
jgi:sigma-B regulation protein RsbU (phosphoserine phosphatase)